MTTYTNIPDAEIDQDSPVTQPLMTALRDNPLAITEGAAGAPVASFGMFSETSAGDVGQFVPFFGDIQNDLAFETLSSNRLCGRGIVRIFYQHQTVSNPDFQGNVFIEILVEGTIVFSTSLFTGTPNSFQADISYEALELVEVRAKTERSSAGSVVVANNAGVQYKTAGEPLFEINFLLRTGL